MQAEDELAAIGLALTSKAAAVVVDVMRGSPSTGIPTKSEQSDLTWLDGKLTPHATEVRAFKPCAIALASGAGAGYRPAPPAGLGSQAERQYHPLHLAQPAGELIRNTRVA